MKVYIVSGWHHYEDTYVLGVYLSEEKAEAAAELERSKQYYDGIDVCEWEVQE
ncbi:hypothetical protein [Salmonella phage SS8]|uniref:DUF7336 domain-containing protein n=1 Tax=Salmonella phage SS5 TaxID=2592216 RepID=A0A5C0CEC3_9CAUD|nr:hypothetical protein QA018_gp52 [Salmonella phage SS5]QDH44757.1 hypothetical protein [Salmonella phage SF4]QDH44773.1 hypothetical protein [Salmonella phage SF5]QDH44883.1 hypothetical protein [Salmonella phage SS4]QDH44922.1 hypothetical protein [Salmonella phage SS10]QDH44990.1 hypothetical protein [Salmonella phage SI2]QDH45076.1 hypothetical protein [Salmonella phage SF1]QEI23562.1 hypothetical protein [Salmonella phage SI1]QEI24419.1 hypothetical protein [Salmonella phage SS6]QEI2